MWLKRSLVMVVGHLPPPPRYMVWLVATRPRLHQGLLPTTDDGLPMDTDDFVLSLTAIASLDDPQTTASRLPGSHKTRKRPSSLVDSRPAKSPSPGLHRQPGTDSASDIALRQIEYHVRNLQKLLEFLLAQPAIPNRGDDLVQLGHRLVHAIKTNPQVGKLIDNVVNTNIPTEAWQEVTGDDAESMVEAPVVAVTPKDNTKPARAKIATGMPPLPPIKDAKLAQQVFTHKSAVLDKFYLSGVELLKLHNERLEFLGDSIINNMVTMMLYERFPDLSEGQLSQKRLELICNKTLTVFLKHYGFPEQLRLTLDRDVIESGAQKAYADIFEAYIGALTVQHFPNMEPVQEWIYRLYDDKVREMERGMEQTEINKDAKLVLYSLVGLALAHPEYKVIAKGNGTSEPFVVECRIGGEVVGVGEASNQKNAGLRAAMEALKRTDVIEKYYKLRLEQEPLVTQVLLKKPQSQSESLEQVDWSKFPVPEGDYSLKLQNQSKNELYGLCGHQFNETPIYRINEILKLEYEAHLYVGDHLLLKGHSDLRKKAMTRAAMAVTLNHDAMVTLFGEDYKLK